MRMTINQRPPVMQVRKMSKSRRPRPYLLLLRAMMFSFQENLVFGSGEPCNGDFGFFRLKPKPLFEDALCVYEGWCVNIFGDGVVGIVKPNEFVNVTVHG